MFKVRALHAIALILVLTMSAALAQNPTQQGPRGPGGQIPGTAEEALLEAARRRAAEERIQRKWDELGGAPGQQRVPGENGLIITASGYYREYTSGGRIYYRPSDTQPFFVYGYIHDKYRQLGGWASQLGWPTSDEQPFTEGGRVTTFERGAIYWWADTGAIELKNIVVRYKGLYCFGETDNDGGSASDEPYVIFGVVPPPPAAASAPRTRVYEEVDAGDSREDNIELYRGLPYGLPLSAVLMENDYDDPDKYQELVKAGADEAAKGVVIALKEVPVVGPALAVAGEALWKVFGDDVAGEINKVLGTDDDHIDTKSFVITAKQMVTLARAGRQNLKGIEWQLDSPLLSGEGSSYKVYFVIEAVEPPVQAVAEPPVPSVGTVVRAQGRVRVPGSTPTTLSKCEAAQKARARNSPAAPGLEAQCLAIVNDLAARGEAIANQDPAAVALRNQQPEGLARRGFDIGMAAAEGQTLPGPGKQSIHDSLKPAEQAGFTAAVSFSLERNRNLERNKNADLAARGEAIANQDPLAVLLRNQQPEGPARRGFDIGMAAAEGQTLPGPGKDRIRDSLPPAEQGGFTTAVTFSLERNKNLKLATTGATIAEADTVVAQSRNAETNAFYRLGFDIATGIFGDPALGALGNTATGPGSLGIRDSLSAAGRRGFNASVALHLSRNYRR